MSGFEDFAFKYIRFILISIIVIKYTGENPVACLWDEAKIKKRRKSRFLIHEKFSCTDISYL